MENWHNLSADEALQELGSRRSGFTEDEARERLPRYGYNELKREEQRQPLFWSLRKEKNILITILLIVAMLSVLVPLIFRISISACLKSCFRIIGQAM